MNLKRVTFLCIALLICGMAVAEPRDEKALTVRTFQFKYKDADKATAVVKTMLSPEGSISIPAGSNALVITDRPENLKEIAAALAKYDAAPQLFRLDVRIVAASRDGSGSVPAELKDIAGKLALLRFNTVESLGSADMLEVAQMGLHVAQMTSQAGMRACFDAVTVNAAKVLGLERYGLEPGCDASFVLLQARDPLSERVHLGKAQFALYGLSAVIISSLRRIGRPRPVRNPQDAQHKA